MKQFHKYLLAIIVLAGACDNDESRPVDIGLDYFPLQTGNYYIYNVEETIYSEVAPIENLVYQLRVEVVDSFPNPEGNYTYVMNRSQRSDENAVWADLDTWSVRGSDREVVVNEENIPFVKLSFPAVKGKLWNGNRFNNLGEDEYKMTAFDAAFDAGGTTFDKTLTVLQENNEDFIVFLDKREEVYARGVGLVYKETTQISYCTTEDCVGQQQIKSGTVYKQQISDYGVQ